MPEDFDANFQRFLDTMTESDRTNLLSYLSNKQKNSLNSGTFERQLPKLREAFLRYNTTNHFHPGDLITWKQGLKNRAVPVYGQPAVVVKVYAESFPANVEDTSSSYYNEPLDIMAGVINTEGHMVFFHFDSGRFEPFTHKSTTQRGRDFLDG